MAFWPPLHARALASGAWLAGRAQPAHGVEQERTGRGAHLVERGSRDGSGPDRCRPPDNRARRRARGGATCRDRAHCRSAPACRHSGWLAGGCPAVAAGCAASRRNGPDAAGRWGGRPSARRAAGRRLPGARTWAGSPEKTAAPRAAWLCANMRGTAASMLRATNEARRRPASGTRRLPGGPGSIGRARAGRQRRGARRHQERRAASATAA